MKILINGKPSQLEGNVTVQSLLDSGYVEMQEYVTVQVNDAIVPKEKYASYAIHDGDAVEFLYYMGGGDAGRCR